MFVSDLMEFMGIICPLELAEDWDNVGLLLGDRNKQVKRVMTCLTITRETVAEAVRQKADCIVSHHPFPFHPEKKWTTDTSGGRILLTLLADGITVYSPHTGHDSALFGINRQLAEMLELVDIIPLYPGTVRATPEMLAGLDETTRNDLDDDLETELGSGRTGRLAQPLPLIELVHQVKELLAVPRLQWVGTEEQQIQTVAIGCGAADEFIGQAVRQNADLLLVGEARFHSYLEARANGLALILPGHFATERFAMKTLAKRIKNRFPELDVWCASSETDPVQFA